MAALYILAVASLAVTIYVAVQLARGKNIVILSEIKKKGKGINISGMFSVGSKIDINTEDDED